MKLLPARTRPWREPFLRRHAPAARSYRGFRECLRWEFGFSCAVCLCHESDLFEHGVEGSGLMHIEHLRLQRDAPEVADSYPNCLFVCRFCNQARQAKPLTDGRGACLLTPTDVAWADRFELVEDRLAPRDPDATYTHRVYDLDDPRKRAMRRFRHEQIEAGRALLREGPALRDALLDKGLASRDPDLIAAAHRLDVYLRRARRDLARFGAIPGDCGAECACSPQPALALPPQLDEQTWDSDELGALV